MTHLSVRMYAALSAIIFTLVSLVHLVRLVEQSSVVVFGWSVPMWGSFVGLVIGAYLAFEGFHIAWPMGHRSHEQLHGH